MTALEVALPTWRHQERRSRRIHAPAEATWQASTELTSEQLTVTRPVESVRRLGQARKGPAGPFLTNGRVRLFTVDKPSDAVGGAIIRPWRRNPARTPLHSMEEFLSFGPPGWVKCLTDFQVIAERGANRLTTTNRCLCTGRDARARFPTILAVHPAVQRPHLPWHAQGDRSGDSG